MITRLLDRSIRSARAAARWVRHGPDRLTHARRRARLVRQLAEWGPPSDLLVLCLGNICRSPYAEARLKVMLENTPVRVTSAGLIGPGRPAPETARAAALLRGLDLTGHRSRLVTSAELDPSTLALVMNLDQTRALVSLGARADRLVMLGDLDSVPIETRAIIDPYQQDESVFEAVYARIDRCVTTLVAAWFDERR